MTAHAHATHSMNGVEHVVISQVNEVRSDARHPNCLHALLISDMPFGSVSLEQME